MRAADKKIFQETRRLFDAHRRTIFRHTDRMFAVLMAFQWIGAIVAALLLSPTTWAGELSWTNNNVWAAIFLGGLLSVFPIVLAIWLPGETATRYVIACSQMMMSGLLIHITGGRIETHFHVFGSLAFLSFYRDWKVLIPATVIVAADHMIRGLFWPESVFGVLNAQEWRWVEHAGWVAFENLFLIIAIRRSINEMWDIAHRTAEMARMNDDLERRVEDRTAELAETNRDLAMEVTERKIAQDALLESEEQLRAFNDKLQVSNRELQDFAYVASHDLQEPLRKVQAFADRLRSKYSEELEGDGLDYLERMRNAASRMQMLIQDLLSFSRVSTKGQPFIPVDLKTVVQEVLSDLEVKIEETGAVIEIGELPTIKADPLQMRQIIQNLVGNALKFKPTGVEPRIQIRSKVSETEFGKGPKCELVITDNGIGFDEKYSEKIFTVFQRLHGRAEYEGSGVGLAICRKIVERHKGSIVARSKPGEGASFIVTLPVAQPNETV